MKEKRLSIIGIALILLVLAVACSFNISTAKVKDAYMAREVNGVPEKTTTFGQDEPFFCIVDLSNAPDDTSLKAAWYAADVEGIDPDFFIDEAEIVHGEGEITFDLVPDTFWPPGTFRVDLFLNGEMERSLEFQVQ